VDTTAAVQRQVWTGVKNLVPTGIRSWTVQPVGSHYAAYIMMAHMFL